METADIGSKIEQQVLLLESFLFIYRKIKVLIAKIVYCRQDHATMASTLDIHDTNKKYRIGASSEYIIYYTPIIYILISGLLLSFLNLLAYTAAVYI